MKTGIGFLYGRQRTEVMVTVYHQAIRPIKYKLCQYTNVNYDKVILINLILQLRMTAHSISRIGLLIIGLMYNEETN